MKRVLLTVHKFFPDHRAGTEVLTLGVAKELQRRGYETLVLSANPPDQDARLRGGPETSSYEYEGVKVHIIEEALRLKSNQFTSEYYNPSVRKHVKSLLDDFAPDLVHVYHAQNLSSSVIDEAVARQIPVVISATDFWFICPVVQLKRPDGAICRGPSPFALNCLSCYTPALFPPFAEFQEVLETKQTAATPLLDQLPKPLANLSARVMYSGYISNKLPAAVQATMSRPQALRKAANSSAAITVPTLLMRDLFVENGINPGIIHHVPFGLDIAALTPFQTKSASETLRIGFIGTLYEHKGVDLLIRAFLNLPSTTEAVLKIYGDDNQFPEYSAGLKQLVQNGSANRSKISFEGTFPNSELGLVLANLDVLVVPSRWYENTPLVIQSALATKTPVVATDLGGMSELVKHEINGLLFKLNDYNSLSAQLLRLATDRDLLSSLTANIKPERTTEQMVDQLEEIYENSC